VLQPKLGVSDILRVGLGLAISGFFVWLLADKLNLSQVFSLLREASGTWIIAGIGLLSVDYVLRAIRWWLMIRKDSPQVFLSSVFCVLLAGFAANNVLPLRAGDVMRAFWFNRRLQSSSGFLLGTLILERALDLLTLLTIWLIVITTTHFQMPRAGLIHAVLLLTIAGVVALGIVLTMAAKIESLMVRIAHLFFGDRPVVGKIIFSIRSVFAVFKSCGPRLMLGLIALSGGAWILEGAVFWMVANALHLRMIASSPWLAFVFGNFAAMIPSAPGYVGTFHAAVITALLTTGCERNAAASFAIFVHAVIWICVTSTGAITYFVSSGEKREAPEVAMISVPGAG
jgi:glycosyltransferase 2 family protein